MFYQSFSKCFESLEIKLPQSMWVGKDFLACQFETAKLRRLLERKLFFFGRGDLNQDDFVPSHSKQL